MKNQIQEVIKEDLDESVRSNTARSISNNNSKEAQKDIPAPVKEA